MRNDKYTINATKFILETIFVPILITSIMSLCICYLVDNPLKIKLNLSVGPILFSSINFLIIAIFIIVSLYIYLRNKNINFMSNKIASNLDEIKKLKELLDFNAITKAEYEAKKKELLGLKNIDNTK